MNQDELLIEKDIEEGDVQHIGNLSILGDVHPGRKVEATGNVTIYGNVENAKVLSLEGDVKIHGVVEGELSEVRAGKNVEVKVVKRRAKIKAKGRIILHEEAWEAELNAREKILAPTARIAGGKACAEEEIEVRILGSPDRTPTEARLENFSQKELFEKMMTIEHDMRETLDRMQKLERTIELVKLLGERVKTLPPEKKMALAMEIKEYQNLRKRLQELQAQNEELTMKAKTFSEKKRNIKVYDTVYPGVKVVIDSSSLVVNQTYKKVNFYKSGIIIVGHLREEPLPM